MREPGPTVFLHVGAMKTGTTYLQHVLAANPDDLAAAGFLFPGGGWGAQVRAVRDVLRIDHEDPVLRRQARGSWNSLASEILDRHDAVSIVSMEFLSFAGPRGAQKVVRSLRGAEVHVVLTVRDTAATIPSLWQSTVENGSTVTWEAFQRYVRACGRVPTAVARVLPSSTTRHFLRSQDVPRALAVWRRAVGATRLHVVTVPATATDPRVLWERFARAVGLPPGCCRRPPGHTNPSLGYASTQLLRLVNEELTGLPRSDYFPTVKEQLALRVLTHRRSLERRPLADAETLRFATRWNARVREALPQPVHLVGTLEDLPLTTSGTPDAPDVPPGPEELLEAAATALAGMRTLVRRRERRLRRAGAPVQASTAAHDGSDPDAHRWDGAPDPVPAAVVEIADLVLTAVKLDRRLRALTGDRTPQVS